MVTASPYPIKINTDHMALKTLLASPDNDAHGRIARWQDHLGECDYELIHRNASVHFMGIADGMSRLPTRCQSKVFAEDTERIEAMIAGVLPVKVTGTIIGRKPSAKRAWDFRSVMAAATQKKPKVTKDDVPPIKKAMEEDTETTKTARMDVLKQMWKDWLSEKDYRLILLYKLGGELGWQDEDLGRQEKRKLRESSKRFVLGQGSGEYKPLFYREEDGSLSHCVKNRVIERTLATIHDTHGHFSTGITAGRAYGRYYWPTRTRDIGSWVASCPVCQRVGPLRQSGHLKTIVQFSPFDMIGMDYVGLISPPCKVTGNRFILIMVDYFSRFLFA